MKKNDGATLYLQNYDSFWVGVGPKVPLHIDIHSENSKSEIGK